METTIGGSQSFQKLMETKMKDSRTFWNLLETNGSNR
jgi:hypothetical protein